MLGDHDDFPDFPTDEPYDPPSLSGRQLEVIRLHTLGIPNEEIAEEIGLSPRVVKSIVTSELGRTKVAELQSLADIDTADVISVLNESMVDAALVYGDIFQDRRSGPQAALALRAAADLLDRTGIPKQTQSTIQVNAAYSVKHSLVELKAKAAELNIGQAGVIEGVRFAALGADVDVEGIEDERRVVV